MVSHEYRFSTEESTSGLGVYNGMLSKVSDESKKACFIHI